MKEVRYENDRQRVVEVALRLVGLTERTVCNDVWAISCIEQANPVRFAFKLGFYCFVQRRQGA